MQFSYPVSNCQFKRNLHVILLIMPHFSSMCLVLVMLTMNQAQWWCQPQVSHLVVQACCTGCRRRPFSTQLCQLQIEFIILLNILIIHKVWSKSHLIYFAITILTFLFFFAKVLTLLPVTHGGGEHSVDSRQ